MRFRSICLTALPLILSLAAAPAPASAQPASVAAQPPGGDPAAAGLPPAPAEAQDMIVDFSADAVTYDSGSEMVIASGRVRMAREGYYLAADEVRWSRASDEVMASGNVVVTSPEGDRLIGDKVVLTDALRDATMDNMLVVLETGGRLAATSGTRSDGLLTLSNVVYSPCPVTTPAGCPRKPGWTITAARVIHDPVRGRVRFHGGRLEILGVSFPLLPVFSTAVGGEDSGFSGWLTPNLSLDRRNGLELAVPYHIRWGPSRDLTLTPHLYTGTLPAIEARYRHLNRLGAFQAGTFVTYSERIPARSGVGERDGLRAYLEANGKAQLDPLWSLTGQLRLASDKTLLRRYDLSRDDKLRSFASLERIDLDSYVSIAGWAFQGLRAADRQRRIPIALPAVDARLRLAPPLLGGKVELQANSLAILRRDGQDTQRAFIGARWDLRRLTAWGQELGLTAYGRADAYHTNGSDETATAVYRGTDGWHFRGIGALAADLRWPLVGPLLGGLQRLTPRVQMVVSPPTSNLKIPNEDARAVDLEDSNLFALNRFPGYDRWEDSSRLTYGLEWTLDRPGMAIRSTIGQSYRLQRKPGIFPDGTGLTDRISDIVGRTRIQFGRLIDLTQRFRLDKDNLAIRRNELDLTYGTDQTYVRVGYLRLNRDISPTIEDLRDKEELRLAGRWKFASYWSLFGATVLDLTGKREDPLSLADGFEPVRHRLGLSYEDECLEIGLSWRRDYERIGEVREGNRFQVQFSLKGLGR